MAEGYRYYRSAVRLEFYTMPYDFGEQHFENETGEQLPFEHSFIAFDRSEVIAFADDLPDIRDYAVNTPNGNLMGKIVGFLADTANLLIPYAYVQVTDGRIVVVPTNQFMFYPNMQLVTLEGGQEALRYAPDASRTAGDAARADRYWVEFRRQNAA